MSNDNYINLENPNLENQQNIDMAKEIILKEDLKENMLKKITGNGIEVILPDKVKIKVDEDTEQ